MKEARTSSAPPRKYAPASPSGTGRRLWSAAYTATVAASGVAGVYGLGSGGISFGADIDARLPFHSSLLAGLALLCFVVVPHSWAAVSAWRGMPRADDLLTFAGGALVAWIAVELAFIQTYSWFHPVFLAVGLGTLWAGWHPLGRGTSSGRTGRLTDDNR